MTGRSKSNFERFLECSSPRVPIHYDTLRKGSSSSSSVASGAKAEDEEVRKPRIVLGDIWSALEDWSTFGREIPLSVEGINEKANHYYAPSLSALQIFTVKPFTDNTRSSATGIDGTVTGTAKPESSSKRVLNADHLGYLYFQYNEITRPSDRHPLYSKIKNLAKKKTGLSSLTSSDLSPYSWISIAWYPIYPIPSVGIKKDLSAAFLTYHSLTPDFPETVGKDGKGNEQGVSSTTEVELPPFAAVTYKAYGDLWIMPGTSDNEKIEMLEKSASSWLKTLGFFHNDFNFFMSRKLYGVPK